MPRQSSGLEGSHTGLQLVPPEHTVPHDPQLSRSFRRSAQTEPQSVFPVGQMHTPRLQDGADAGHANPQLPQLLGSNSRSTQWQSRISQSEPQSVLGKAHVHKPPEQISF